MAESERSCVIPLAEAQKRIPGAPGAQFATFMQRGTVRVLLSLPVSPNRQTPKTRSMSSCVAGGFSFIVAAATRSKRETLFS